MRTGSYIPFRKTDVEKPHVSYASGGMDFRRGYLICKTKLLSGIISAFCGIAFCADYYVDPNGNDANPGSPAEPVAKISTAVGLSSDGDIIHVGAGQYNEWNITVNKAVTIIGEGQTRSDTVVYGFETPYSGIGRRIFYITADAVIANITVMNGGFRTDGTKANGGNVFMSAGTVTNCVLAGGYVEHTQDSVNLNGALGGNLFISGGLVVDCDIMDGGIYNVNGAGGGGNVMMYNGGRLMRCNVTGGRRTSGSSAGYTTNSGGSGIYMNGAVVAENCLIRGNSGTYGAVAMCGAATLINCTVAGNSGNHDGYNGIVLKDSSPSVINCVMAGNGGTAVNEWGNKNASRFFNCTSTVQIDGGNDCVLIRNSLENTFTDLVSYRPSVEAEFLGCGSEALYLSNALSPVDLAGDERIESGIDIGAYEFTLGPVTASEYVTLTGNPVSFKTTRLDDGVTSTWHFGDGSTAVAVSDVTQYSYPTAGVYSVSFVISRQGADDEVLNVMKPVRVLPKVVYVDEASANPQAPYVSPEMACQTVSEAFASIRDPFGDIWINGITVRIAPGTYTVTDMVLERPVTLEGTGETRDDVILQAQATAQASRGHRVLYISGNAVVANMTIRNGYIETNGKDENGGNVFMSAGTITNCVITGGRVDHTRDASIYGALGGNLYMRGGLVVDSVISNGVVCNVVGAGGGNNVVMYGGGARLMRCRITGGTRTGPATGSYANESGGSGIYMNGNTVAENCLICGNSGSSGAVSMIGASRLVNCTVIDNAGNYGGRNGLYVRDANPLIINSVIFGDDTAAGSWGGSYGSCFKYCASSTEIAGGDNCFAIPGQIEGYFADHVDYRPLSSSGLLNSGADELYGLYAISETDLDGSARKVGSIGVGCYEIVSEGFSCSASVNKLSARSGEELFFNAKSIGADNVTYTWDFGNGEQLVSSESIISYAFPTCGVFYVTLTADAGARGTDSVELLPITIVPPVLYVDAANENPAHPYNTPGKAANSLKVAAAAVKDSDGKMLADEIVVHIAPGTYTESEIDFDRSVYIYGDGENRDSVVLQAGTAPVSNRGRVLTLKDGGCVRDLTIRNGDYTTRSSDINGGNLYIAGGVVSNCVIEAGHVRHTSDGELKGVLGGNLYLAGASAYDCVIRNGSIENVNGAGGGLNVAMTGSGRLVRCRVEGAFRTGNDMQMFCEVSGGSGIYANGNITIENCLITDNSGSYGALSLWNGARLVNCTVVGGHGNWQGCDGVLLRSDTCAAVNTVMYNGATNAACEWGGTRGACFANCASPVAIEGGTACLTLTMPVEAVFKDLQDYAIGSTSPLKNKGSAYLGEDRSLYGVDIRGIPRFIGKFPDIGCYESPSAGTTIFYY